MPYSYAFLFIEFPKKTILTRLRYQVKQWHFHFPRIQITERSQRLGFKGYRSRKAFIVIDSRISENDLFQELRNYISEKYGVSKESVTFRWEKEKTRQF